MKKYPESIYLGGSSWGSAFYIGAFKSLQEKYGRNIGKKMTVFCDSAGALLGLAFVLNMSIEEMRQIYIALADSAQTNGVMRKMTIYHKEALNKILKNKDDYKKVNGRLHVGVTFHKDKKTKRFCYWNSNEELKHTLLCSFHIPFYCTYDARMFGNKVLDGAFGTKISDFPRKTITMGMDERFDLSSNLTTKCITFPLDVQKMDSVIDDGYRKMTVFNSDREQKTICLFPVSVWKVLNNVS